MALDINNKTTWDGKTKLNILVIGLDRKANGYAFVDYATIVALNPVNKGIGIFAIDPDIAFQGPHGQTTIKKAYNIEQNENNSVSSVVTGVEKIFAINVDKYIILDKEGFVAMQDLIGSLNVSSPSKFIEEDFTLDSKPLVIEEGKHKYSAEKLLGVMSADELGTDVKLSSQTEAIEDYFLKVESLSYLFKLIPNLSLLNNVDTDISKLEFIRIYLLARKVQKPDLRVGYTRQASVIVGTNGKTPLTDNIDKDVQSIFLDVSIVKEQARLEVLNGTGQAGIAQKYARFFNNTGIRVVRAGNSVQDSDETTLFFKEKDKYPSTVNEIKALFGDNIKIVEQEYKYKHIGDLVLVIGKDGV